jgi:hypothetical protein
MVYQNFQTYSDFAGPLRAAANLAAAALCILRQEYHGMRLCGRSPPFLNSPLVPD